MRIESSALSMQGSSSIVSTMSIQESLNIWTGQGSAAISSSSFDIQEFSQQGITVSTSVTSSTTEASECEERDLVKTEQELRIKLLEDFLSRLTRKRVRLQIPDIKQVTDGYDSSGQALGNLKITFSDNRATRLGVGSGFGLIYNRSETQIERSRVSFAAEGVVKTTDGREIKLDLNFNIDQQVIQQSNFQLRAGEALKDPLVINFGGSVASFTERTMSFDLDYDGIKDTVQMLNANSGYLALDKNDNGIVDDGRELFGPQTDNGYGELMKYDEDGNGWIDENDSVFDHLKIWYHDEQGNSKLVALTDKNVGAIYLGSVDTRMNMYNQTGMAGALKQSGLVLLENGESRVMQELDLRI
ncbi:MAG: hypothetical protein AAGU75_01380 [Bacillota bacterium]